uniref:Gag-pol protein n=1 Tax=Solanum tuberosum TaxID=4113 RepID=M1DB10_SOLTU
MSVDYLAEEVTHDEFRVEFHMLAQDIMVQANREVVARVNLGGKEKLSAYQLKGVAQVWFNHWKDERAVDVNPLNWEKFKVTFLDSFFTLEIRETKVLELINLCNEGLSTRQGYYNAKRSEKDGKAEEKKGWSSQNPLYDSPTEPPARQKV